MTTASAQRRPEPTRPRSRRPSTGPATSSAPSRRSARTPWASSIGWSPSATRCALRLGPKQAIVLSHPEMARHLLVTNVRNYVKQTPAYAGLRLVLGNGLLTSDGDFWLRQRRLAQPAFHKKHVADFGEIMVRAATGMVDRWERRLRRPEGPRRQPRDDAGDPPGGRRGAPLGGPQPGRRRGGRGPHRGPRVPDAPHPDARWRRRPGCPPGATAASTGRWPPWTGWCSGSSPSAGAPARAAATSWTCSWPPRTRRPAPP